MRGRERHGIVTEAKRDELLDEIAQALLAEIDPVTEMPAVTKVYQRDEHFHGRGQLEVGPDIIVGYAKGTGGGGADALGAVGSEILTDNTRPWTGDHLMDHEAVPGILLTSRPLKKPAPRLQDLAAAVLAEFGIDDRSTRHPPKTEGGLMFGPKVKLDPELIARVKKFSDIAGYSSPAEFITHAVEKELAKLEDAGSEEEIKKRLKGLGYIS